MLSSEFNANRHLLEQVPQLAACLEFYNNFEHSHGIEAATHVRQQAKLDANEQLELAALVALLEGHRALADYEKALRIAADLLDLARKLENNVAQFGALLDIAWAYLSLGKFEDAIRALDEALASNALTTMQHGRIYLVLADAYFLGGQYAKAGYICRKAETTVYRELGESWNPWQPGGFTWDAEFRFRSARIATAEKRIFDAWDTLDGLIEHAKLASDPNSGGRLGWNKPHEADEIARYWRQVEPVAHYELGTHLVSLRRYEAAKKELIFADTRAEARRDDSLAMLIQEQLGIVALEYGDADGALAHFDRALGKLETMLNRLRIEEFHLAVRELGQRLFERALICALLAKNSGASRAWHYSERSRARMFLDSFGRSEGTALLSRLAARQEYVGLSHEIIQTQEQMRSSSPGLQTDWLQSREERLREKKAKLLAEMRRESPLDARLAETPVATWMEVSRALDKDTCVAEFFVTADELVVLFGTHESIVAHTLPIKREAIRNKVRRQRELIAVMHSAHPSDSALSELDQVSADLYEVLFGNFAAEIGRTSRLYIVPHDLLHWLPFACLRAGKHWLSERVQLIRAPSGSILLKLLERTPQPPPKSAAVFVNPEPKWARLPFAELEGKRIRKVMPGAVVYRRGDAKIATFREEAPRKDILHFACHAVFHTDAPLLSYLRLAADPETADTGILDVNDLHGIRLKAGLVVLSACETGLSEITTAEELVGLVQAFMVAGASSVIASLWPVSDRANAEFMGAFYEHLLLINDKAAALNHARTQTRKIPQYAAPFFWSAFELYGDWRIAS